MMQVVFLTPMLYPWRLYKQELTNQLRGAVILMITRYPSIGFIQRPFSERDVCG